MRHHKNRAARHDAEQQESTKEAKVEIDMSEVDALLNDVECCIAESEAVAETIEQRVQTDEEAAESEYAALKIAWVQGKMSNEEYRDQGNLYKVKFAHTQFVQTKACCSCGCPWEE